MVVKFAALKEARALRLARKDKTGRDERKYWTELEEAHKDGTFEEGSHHIGDLFKSFVVDSHGDAVGDSVFQEWRGNSTFSMFEENIRTADFANAMRLFAMPTMMKIWNDPVFIADELVETIPSDEPFDEKIFDTTAFGDDSDVVQEGEEFPVMKIGEQWLTSPKKEKRGGIVYLTKEILMGNRSGMVRAGIANQTRALRISKEKRILDMVVGATSSYRRNDSAVIATYGDNSGTHNWDNLVASNALSTYVNIDNAQQALEAIVDPDTGEPSSFMGDTFIGPPALRLIANTLSGASSVIRGDGASQTFGTNGSNPFRFKSAISQYVKNRTSSDTTWFWGTPKSAFTYIENTPISTMNIGAGSLLEFQRDIVFLQRVSERGIPFTRRPHAMVKCTA